eukprot:13292510-Heterocapsa_arctica.AAC.1
MPLIKLGINPLGLLRVGGGNTITDWTSYAIAKYRAIELANGDGLLSDPSDVETWRGVDLDHLKECRKLRLIWESDVVISFVPDPDGHTSYGRVHWHGTRGVVPVAVSTHSASRIQTYTDSSSKNIGDYPD